MKPVVMLYLWLETFHALVYLDFDWEHHHYSWMVTAATKGGSPRKAPSEPR